jgi:hypothetical protein
MSGLEANPMSAQLTIAHHRRVRSRGSLLGRHTTSVASQSGHVRASREYVFPHRPQNETGPSSFWFAK